MPRFAVMYFDDNETERETIVRADDAAAALGLVMDDAEDIAPGSPFAVCEVIGRKKAKRVSDARRKRVNKAGAKSAAATEGIGQPGRDKVVPPAGNTEIDTGPVHDVAAALGAIPLPERTADQQFACEQLSRILESTGCELEG